MGRQDVPGRRVRCVRVGRVRRGGGGGPAYLRHPCHRLRGGTGGGKVLNPTLARGQVQGGVVQGIGWALMEECKWRDGAMANNQLTNYLIPTSDDVPSVRVAFLENPYPHGAGGAKGLGELPIDGPAPAILNAEARATGADPRAIPLTPERLMDLLERGG